LSLEVSVASYIMKFAGPALSTGLKSSFESGHFSRAFSV